LGSTPVLQISASAVTPIDRALGLENGADAYLVEPVDPDVLVATIRALLRMRKAEAELAEMNNALKVAYERLQKTNEDLQSFAHAASHDLKEPLRTISCFAGLLEKQYRERLDGDAEMMLTNIQNGVSRMSALIDGLLAYAQAGPSGEDTWTDVDLNSVVLGVVRDLKRSIEENGASVSVDRLPIVRGNETSLSQLFQNLIQNGLKYRRGGEPARLVVTALTLAKGMAQLAIADNGLGIPLEYQKKIFAPFQRLHGSEVAGFGVGLATCQRIVERHGGKIWVESAGLGKGSIFHFTLPLA
jgi:signal transduction histidine kinase